MLGASNYPLTTWVGGACLDDVEVKKLFSSYHVMEHQLLLDGKFLLPYVHSVIIIHLIWDLYAIRVFMNTH